MTIFTRKFGFASGCILLFAMFSVHFLIGCTKDESVKNLFGATDCSGANPPASFWKFRIANNLNIQNETDFWSKSRFHFYFERRICRVVQFSQVVKVGLGELGAAVTASQLAMAGRVQRRPHNPLAVSQKMKIDFGYQSTQNFFEIIRNFYNECDVVFTVGICVRC